MADVSVRPATQQDADEIARIQVDTWRIAYSKVLPQAVLDSLDATAAGDVWRSSITTPPTPDHHVLVAVEGDWRVGFAAFGPDGDAQPSDPAPDATAAISVLLVEPRWSRRGHGSRLLAAITDIARAADVTRLVAWVPVSDTAALEFYRSSGWGADGMQRSLDTGSGTVSELRLHTSLAD